MMDYSISYSLMHIKQQQKSQQGLALLVVLWMISIMLMISASLLYSVKVESALTHYQRERAISHAHSEAALRYAIQQLLLNKPQREIKNLFKPFTWTFEDSQAEIHIVAENGLIDLNKAPRNLLKKLLIQNGVQEEKYRRLLDRIADFKDKDNLNRLNGAEDPDYIEAGFPAGAKDAPFERIEELQQVLGIDVVLYRKLKKYLTVNAQSKGINPMLAPRHILLLLADNDIGWVDDFIQKRDTTEDAVIPFPFENSFISYTHSKRYRISIKLTQSNKPSDFLSAYSIRLTKDKIPPFSGLSRF
jgi:general secretion pathway protein K